MNKNRKRENQIHLYFSDDELQIVRAKMCVIGTKNLSAYLRKMAVDGEVKVIDIDELKRMNKLLNNIGNNINQIAKRVNMTDAVYGDDIAEINHRLEEIWLLQESILSH